MNKHVRTYVLHSRPAKHQRRITYLTHRVSPLCWCVTPYYYSSSTITCNKDLVVVLTHSLIHLLIYFLPSFLPSSPAADRTPRSKPKHHSLDQNDKVMLAPFTQSKTPSTFVSDFPRHEQAQAQAQARVAFEFVPSTRCMYTCISGSESLRTYVSNQV